MGRITRPAAVDDRRRNREGGPWPRRRQRPTCGRERTSRRPSKWRTRGSADLRHVRPPIVVVYPVASLMFRLRYRHAERIPPRGPVLLVANHVSILDPLACARLVFDNGRLPHFLAKQSVFKGFAGTLLRSAGQIPVARYSADAHERARRGQGRPRRRQRHRDLPRGLGHPRPGLVADAGAHRGGPAGADHRRRRPAGRPVGPAAGARLPPQEAASALPRTRRLPRRRAGRPLRASGPQVARRAAR